MRAVRDGKQIEGRHKQLHLMSAEDRVCGSSEASKIPGSWRRNDCFDTFASCK